MNYCYRQPRTNNQTTTGISTLHNNPIVIVACNNIVGYYISKYISILSTCNATECKTICNYFECQKLLKNIEIFVLAFEYSQFSFSFLRSVKLKSQWWMNSANDMKTTDVEVSCFHQQTPDTRQESVNQSLPITHKSILYQ